MVFYFRLVTSINFTFTYAPSPLLCIYYIVLKKQRNDDKLCLEGATIVLFIDKTILSPILQKSINQLEIPVYSPSSSPKIPEKLLTNSESCLKVIEELYPTHPHIQLSHMLKDKASFRKALSSLLPNFFYRLSTLSELSTIPVHTLPFPLVIKPNKGYSSVGVKIVQSDSDWTSALKELEGLQNQYKQEQLYDSSVLQLDEIIVEEWIDGPEFAIDCYFNSNGDPVILSILQHLFSTSQDTSDRLYVTNNKIIQEQINEIKIFLQSLYPLFPAKDFPFHIEVRKTRNGFVPIEINPLRFAGAGTTDIAYHAFGINTSLAYFQNQSPDWDALLQTDSESFYGFVVAELPVEFSLDKKATFQHEKLKQQFSNLLEYREITASSDRTLAIIFFKTAVEAELQSILTLDFHVFL